VKVFGNNKFSVFVYKDHPPPHCHVRLGDKSDVCVAIPLIQPMYGAEISREVREEIENNLEALIEAWDKLNPKRQK
jgi:hypothetical protein